MEKIFLIYFLVFSSITVFCQTENFNNQLLWQISGKNLKKPSYLFGSLHSNDHKVFNFSDSTYAALQYVDAIVTEADLSSLFDAEDMRNENVELKFDANGKAYTTNKKASFTRYGNEDGRPQFLDMYFHQFANISGKKYFALETIDEQLEVLEFVYSQNKPIRNLERYNFIENKMYNAYIEGDINLVRDLLLKEYSQSKIAYDRLISKRNTKMCNGIDTLMKNGSLFVAVGAAHLAGDDGIIELLRKKGYNLKKIVATYNDVEIKSKVLRQNKLLYNDGKFDFQIAFTGTPIIDTSGFTYRLIYQELGQGNTYIVEIEKFKEKLTKENVKDILISAENAQIKELTIGNDILAFESVGYEFAAGLAWKRIFLKNEYLFKLICYGGNKFMSSNRPQNYFDSFKFNE